MIFNRGWCAALVLGQVVLFAEGSASATDSNGHIPGRHIDRRGRVVQEFCPAETRGPGEARCYARRIVTDVQPDAVPAGLGATDIQNLYSIPAGATSGGAIIALVDVGGYPSALSDLNNYRSQYGLGTIAKCSSTLPAPGGPAYLSIVSETGSTQLPKANSEWEGEEALDMQMVSATCPDCSIVLVQANTQNNSDFDAAVDFAATIPGITAITTATAGPKRPRVTSTRATQATTTTRVCSFSPRPATRT